MGRPMSFDEVENVVMNTRLWEAVLDAFQLPENQLKLAMQNNDPVKRMHFIQDLLWMGDKEMAAGIPVPRRP